MFGVVSSLTLASCQDNWDNLAMQDVVNSHRVLKGPASLLEMTYETPL